MDNSKACTKCGQIKPISEFGFHRGTKSAKSGIRPACKKCESDDTKQRYYANKGLKPNPSLEWRKKNPEAWKRLQRKSYEANREKRIAEMKIWAENNPILIRNYASIRRVRKLSAKTFLVTPKEIKKMLSKPCSYCYSSQSTQLDHIIPLSRGGDHSIGNLTGSCKKCNLSKGAKFITEWKKGKN